MKKGNPIAEKIHPTLVDISNLSKSACQAILDVANPKFIWMKCTSRTAFNREPSSFALRIINSEYERLANAGLIPDYLGL